MLVAEFGARADLVDTFTGEAPLHVACREGRDSTVRLLGGACGCPLAPKRRSDGFTPLHEAARWGRQGCAKVLLSLVTDAKDPSARQGASSDAQKESSSRRGRSRAKGSRGASASQSPGSVEGTRGGSHGGGKGRSASSLGAGASLGGALAAPDVGPAARRAAVVALVNAEATVPGRRPGEGVQGRGVTPAKVAATYAHLQVRPGL
jgi:hypothetical protein